MPPADISLLSIDLKYSGEGGVKICEMQQGLNSAYQGSLAFDSSDWMIAEKFSARLSKYGQEIWYCRSGISCFYLSVFKRQKGWQGVRSFNALLKDRDFLRKNRRPVVNRSRLADYNGIVVALYRDIQKQKLAKLKGVIVLNSAFLKHFGDCENTDKLTMCDLFSGDEGLSLLRPHWKFYKKSDWSTLSEEIMEEFSSEKLVIKPRSGRQGKGVIIFERSELSSLLQELFEDPIKTACSSIEAYSYWAVDPHGEFLIEEYCPSRPISDESSPGEHYDATMRVVALLTSDGGKVDIALLSSFWKLPKKPLEGSGTLIEKHKSCYGSDERYLKVSPLDEEEVAKTLREGLGKIYSQILK